MSHNNGASQSDIELYHNIISKRDKYPYVVEAVNVISECISKYTLQCCALSFNGGKDCTVLLHLIRAAMAKLDYNIHDLTTIYFKVPKEFIEVEEFMNKCCKLYNLQFETVSGDFKEALTDIVNQRERRTQPPINAIFMGQRRYDPYCGNLSIISPSDKGWPKFDRINPLLDWTYSDIWTFLRDFNLPYCTLYDQGYTSIGNTNDSQQNPSLYDKTNDTYKPAYMLDDVLSERLGRTERDKTSACAHIGDNVDGSVCNQCANGVEKT